MPEPEPATTSRPPAASKWGLLSDTLKAQRRNLIIATVIGLAWTVGKVASPILVQYGIDRGIGDGDLLWLWAGLIGVAGLVAGTFTAFRRFFAFREARWTETRLREQLFGHIMSLHIGYHDRAQTGQLMSRSSSDLNSIQMFVVMIPITLSNLAMVSAVVVILFVTDWFLALLALSSLPLIQLAGRRFSQSIHPAVLAVQAEQAELATVVEETVGGVRVVKGFGAERVQAAKLRTAADDIRTASIDAARIRAKYLPAIELMPQLGLIAVLWFGGNRVIDGDLMLGQLVLFNLFVALLVQPLRMIGMTIAFAQRASAALQRINEILDVAPEVSDPQHPATLPTTSSDEAPLGAIRFENVRFGYTTAAERGAVADGAAQESAPVLDAFDLDLVAGESVAIVGATGSGKSTIARLLVRFYDVQAGSVSIDGVDVRDLAVHEVRRSVGIVFEDTLLFHDTVRANIAFAHPDAGPETVERAARLAGAHDFVMQLPDAYDTMLGERGFSALRRSTAAGSPSPVPFSPTRGVLVLDDATSAVDPVEGTRDPVCDVDRDGRAHDGRDRPPAGHDCSGRHGRAPRRWASDRPEAHTRSCSTPNPRYRDVLAAMDAAGDDPTATGPADLDSMSTPGRWSLMFRMGGIDADDKLDTEQTRRGARSRDPDGGRRSSGPCSLRSASSRSRRWVCCSVL